MELAKYMADAGLDDEGMAGLVRTSKVKCDRTMIYRYRTKKRRPEWPIIKRIAAITKNAVTANDWMSLETAQ